MRRLGVIATCLLVSAHFSARAARAEILWVVGDGNVLISFDHANPGQPLTSRAITGLAASDQIRGIDFRPASGQLFGLGTSTQLYVIDPATGAATAIGPSPPLPLILGTDSGFDFNPLPDRIRVVSDIEENLRLNPDTGAVAGIDTALAYAEGDVAATGNPTVVAVAYTNSVPGAMATTLYGIDIGNDTLVRIGSINGSPVSPNAGRLFTIGRLGTDAGPFTAFDISSATGTAYLAARGSVGIDLFTVDLSTGAATRIGTIGGTTGVSGLAVSQAAVVFTIPIVGRVIGLNGSLFRTDIRMANASPFPVNVRIDFFSSFTAGPTASANTVLPPNGQVAYDDVLDSLFAIPSGTGAMRFTASRPIGVVANLFNDLRPFGLGINGTTIRGLEESELRMSGVIPGVTNRPASSGAGSRTNVGFFNPGSTEVVLTLRVNSGSGALLGTATRAIGPRTHEQVAWTDLFPALGTLPSVAALSFTATGGSVLVYAGAVDNQTGDVSVTPAIRN